MKQLKKILLLNVVAIAMIFSSLTTTYVSATGRNYIKFSDIKGHWAESSINNFIQKGYINGYEDGTFRPENSITRAEFVSIFNQYFELTKTSGKVFNDTKKHWAKQAIDIAVTNGVTNGVSELEFKPDAPITREQVATMISNYIKLGDSNHDKLLKYKDKNKVSSWALDSVEGIIEKGYMNGYEDNTFRPKNPIKRAEAVVTLSRIIKEKPGTSFSDFQNEVLDLVNVERAKVGLSPLKFDIELANVATIKSQDMADNNYFDHNSPTYGSPFDMMKQFGISYRAAGENIACGYKTPKDVMNGWMNSPGHKANILNASFTHLGVGIAKNSNGTIYWTQMFIGK